MKATVYIATSLDGFIARENGDIDWLLGAPSGPPGEDYGYKKFIATVDAIIMGRNTYEKVLTFGQWPYTGTRVVVLASKAVAIADDRKHDVTWMSGSPAEVTKQLSAEGVKHAYVDGGVTIQRFLAAGLIQRLIITRIPVLIGSGAPLFGPLPHDVNVRLTRLDSWPNGFVQSEYEVI